MTKSKINHQPVRPLLSICIPTRNRAELLRLQLVSLGQQIRGLENDIEIIVSDNASDDNTPHVVEEARRYIPICYHRNDHDIGFVRNFCAVVDQYARGEYCWIIGDDDMVIKGKIPKIVSVLHTNYDLDYVFVNHFLKSIEQRNRLIQAHDSVYQPTLDECRCLDLSERRLSRWEELLDIPSHAPSIIFTGIVGHVFRRSTWVANVDPTEVCGPLFTSLATTFPHIKILATAMIGKPVYYLGDPCVLLATGSQDWIDYLPAIKVIRIGEAVDLFERLGVGAQRIRLLRFSYLQLCMPAIPLLLFDPQLPGRELFSLRNFVWRHRLHPTVLLKLSISILRVAILWKILLPVKESLSQRLPKTVYQSMYLLAKKVLRLLRFF
ncbi:MAG: glycosyltransferase family 2 protein [candidate division KSB1 bacterium]|nr:glycosyltransferase family 2 protein [candidate division KSB1 bacterium]